MGYIQIPGGIPDFDRFLMSLWFVISPATAALLKSGLAHPVPLIIFGAEADIPQYTGRDDTVIGHNPNGTSVFGVTYSPAVPIKSDTSYIGIRASGDDFGLVFNFQMKDAGISTWRSLNPISATPVLSGALDRFGVVTTGSYTHLGFGDTSFLNQSPERYSVQSGTPNLKAEVYHHLLLSGDLRNGSTSSSTQFRSASIQPQFPPPQVAVKSVTEYSKLWYAIDNVNRKGALQMGQSWIPEIKDDNGIVTVNCATQGSLPGPFGSGGPDIDNPGFFTALDPDMFYPPGGTFSYPGGKVPSLGAPFGLPGTAPKVSWIRDVDMAEFQMWIGDTRDTGPVENRVPFIVERQDSLGNNILKPAPLSAARAFMGRRPDVLLHRTGNWKKGRNTGSLGIGDDGKIIDEGQFVPVGDIEKYKPDPIIKE